MPKIVNIVFENLKLEVKQYYQTKLVENAKIEKLKCNILGDFQTLCNRLHSFGVTSKALRMHSFRIQNTFFWDCILQVALYKFKLGVNEPDIGYNRSKESTGLQLHLQR